MPRWVDAERVTFKYGLGEEFIWVLKTLHKLGLDSTTPVHVGGVEVSPRDVVAALPARPGRARRQDARRHVRRHLGDRHRHGRPARARSTCTTPSTTPGRWRSTARRPWCGRRPSTPSSRSSSWPTGAWSGRRCARSRGLPGRAVPRAPGRARRTVGPRRAGCRREPDGPGSGSGGARRATGGSGLERRVTEVELPQGALEDELGQLGRTGVEDPGVQRQPAGVGLCGRRIALRGGDGDGTSARSLRPRRSPAAVPLRPARTPGPSSSPPPPSAPSVLRADSWAGPLPSLLGAGTTRTGHRRPVQELVRHRAQDGAHDGALTAPTHHDDPGLALERPPRGATPPAAAAPPGTRPPPTGRGPWPRATAAASMSLADLLELVLVVGGLAPHGVGLVAEDDGQRGVEGLGHGDGARPGRPWTRRSRRSRGRCRRPSVGHRDDAGRERRGRRVDGLGHLTVTLEELGVPDPPDQHERDADEQQAHPEDERRTEALLHVEVPVEECGS